MALALTIVGVQGMTAKTELALPGVWGGTTLEGSTYTFGGSYNGAATWVDRDWSAYECVWVKYSGYTGTVDLKIEYDEWTGHQSWGDTFDQQSIRFSDASGIAVIAIEKTKTFVNGSAETEGAHKGETYDKHVRQVVIQDAGAASTITIEEIWIGTQAEYLTAIGYDAGANHALKVINGEKRANVWDYQANYTLSAALVKDKTYILQATFLAVNGGETRVVVKGDGEQYLDTKGLYVDTPSRYTIRFTANGNHNKLQFDLGHIAGDVYIDDVSLVEDGKTTNLIENGDFEIPISIAGWTPMNNVMEHAEKEFGVVEDAGVFVSVGAAGWISFFSSLNMRMSGGVKAYTAKYMSEDNYVKLTEVTEVNGYQPVLIQATEGDYVLESPASVTPVGDNDLNFSWSAVTSDDDFTLYALANLTQGLGFYKVKKGVNVPSGKAYLKIAASPTAPEFLGFDGGTTSISEKTVVKSQTVGEYYNLAGQRVAQPTKGLYIVNGKKVVIK